MDWVGWGLIAWLVLIVVIVFAWHLWIERGYKRIRDEFDRQWTP